ncbi:MAG TPA: 1-(5-phosphoribosyl)-5-[(5-phosphoribosylamino)methylideneamino]imidazole-4-carboxamide isomerase [Bacteroidia bacterium]|jgi:phosphoribosylformimino-5-aminoimidazole carboxamide ribotide isomerase|nr:1-(5-phosphoribosyl)-5-[(5-phosphoribosylamino)methylideneamino]imidazole-4-carboxamide isomerase [Bacteroidia bacterium]
MEIIPAIDIIGGRCVRLSQGDYNRKTIYDESPLDAALRFEDAGIKRLHLVDLDGARKGSVVNLKVLEILALKSRLVIDFGGGIKTDDDINAVFNAGASLATVGSMAVTNENLFFQWLKRYGSDKILTGADVKEEKIAIAGWQKETGLSLFEFLEAKAAGGMKLVFCTDISKDGLLQGPAIDLYKKIKERFPELKLIASGGISSVNDLKALKETGCSGAILGKALYEGRISLNELKQYL